jgi:outer membrane protein
MTSLSLDEAIRMARARNGSVVAAYLNVEAAKSRRQQAWGAFLPTILPTYEYESSQSRIETGPFRGRSGVAESRVGVVASLRLLDSGERDLNLRSSRSLLKAQEAEALQTLRETLFRVISQYYGALRAQELLRVQEAQVERTKKIVEQTRARVDLGDAPQKDILQAEADYLNALASKLGAETRVASTSAELLATIGWPQEAPMPKLVSESEPVLPVQTMTLDEAIQAGQTFRSDLLAQRQRIESQRLAVRRSQIDAGLRWSIDADYTRRFSPNVTDRSALTLLASFPLFDGFQSRERVRIEKFSLSAQESVLVQAERTARAEVESAYKEYALNARRFEAAKLALEAARLNYRAAQESQQDGAQGTNVITVLTAQLSLVTAESNYVEAIFDALISDVRLKLVTGQPLPAETDQS